LAEKENTPPAANASQSAKPGSGANLQKGPQKGPNQGGKPGQNRPGPNKGPNKGPNQGPNKGPNKGPNPGHQPVVEIRPLAQPASMKRRHWGLGLSFLVMVFVPLVALSIYLWGVSIDQYASTTGITVRQEESGSATDFLGGLSQFTGGSASGDADILYEFIQSQELIEAIDARLDLRGHYSDFWDRDPLFALWPDADIEDLIWYWQRVVRISYDQSTGLIELRILAFSAQEAQLISEAIVEESQKKINALNASARDDLMRYAESDLEDAVARLKKAREALTKFRTRTRIVDPSADLQGQMGVVNNLQQQLAEALVELDLLLGTAQEGDPRISQAERRIRVIRDRIASEREAFARDEVAGIGEDYPTLMAEFENLSVDREFAEETYRAALTALDIARDKASRQSRYLAAYVSPTLAQSSQYPQRYVLTALAGLFLLMVWAIGALVYYSLRDRR